MGNQDDKILWCQLTVQLVPFSTTRDRNNTCSVHEALLNLQRPRHEHACAQVDGIIIIALVNDLVHICCQAISSTNDDKLTCRSFKINLSETFVPIHEISFNKIHLKVLYMKPWPFCSDLNSFKSFVKKNNFFCSTHLPLTKEPIIHTMTSNERHSA